MSSVARSAGKVSGGSANFGATVRGVLVSPATGFVPALKRVESAAEGSSTYVLGALGGASVLLLWLKVSGLFGIREFAAADFTWGIFAVWLVLAGLIGLAAQAVWSFAAPRAAGPDAASPRSFRAVWALSAFPHLPALLLLLPLDVLFVGGRVFTTEAIGDSVSTAWVALSTAASVSLGAWAGYVFVRGTHAASRATPARTAAVVCLAVAVTAVVVLLLRTGLVALRDVTA